MFGKQSYSVIAAELGCSRSRAGQLVRGALQRAARERDDLAHLGLEQTLHAVQLVVTEAYEVITRECPRCHGHGTRNDKECKRCGGTGFWYGPEERRRWCDRMLRAVDQRSKLLGEYAPEDHRLVGEDGEALSVREIILRMPPEEVAREAQWYLQGRNDERQATGAPTAAVTDADEEEAHAS